MGRRHQIGRVTLTEFKLSAREGPVAPVDRVPARAHSLDYHNLCALAPSNELAPLFPELFIINPNRPHNSLRYKHLAGASQGKIRLRPDERYWLPRVHRFCIIKEFIMACPMKISRAPLSSSRPCSCRIGTGSSKCLKKKDG